MSSSVVGGKECSNVSVEKLLCKNIVGLAPIKVISNAIIMDNSLININVNILENVLHGIFLGVDSFDEFSYAVVVSYLYVHLAEKRNSIAQWVVSRASRKFSGIFLSWLAVWHSKVHNSSKSFLSKEDIDAIIQMIVVPSLWQAEKSIFAQLNDHLEFDAGFILLLACVVSVYKQISDETLGLLLRFMVGKKFLMKDAVERIFTLVINRLFGASNILLEQGLVILKSRGVVGLCDWIIKEPSLISALVSAVKPTVATVTKLVEPNKETNLEDENEIEFTLDNGQSSASVVDSYVENAGEVTANDALADIVSEVQEVKPAKKRGREKTEVKNEVSTRKNKK